MQGGVRGLVRDPDIGSRQHMRGRLSGKRIFACRLRYAHTRAHTHTHTHTHTHIHTHTYTYTYIHTHKHTHARTHYCKHTHTHTHTHIHTHIRAYRHTYQATCACLTLNSNYHDLLSFLKMNPTMLLIFQSHSIHLS